MRKRSRLHSLDRADAPRLPYRVSSPAAGSSLRALHYTERALACENSNLAQL